MTYLAVLSSKGQLTVPKKLRERLDLHQGQRVLLEATGGQMIVKKATVREEEFLEEEWEELKRLADRKGHKYRTGAAFLKSLRSR